MEKIQKVSMIGSGNVAWHLAQAFESVGCVVQEVYSRQEDNAQKLVKKLYDAIYSPKLDFRESTSHLFVLAVSDAAVPEVLTKLQLPKDAYLVHTSGTLPLVSLAAVHDHTGVFYPLQTFSKHKRVDLTRTPICIESEDSAFVERLSEVACLLSDSVYEVSSKERKVLHMAGVFACNFTNHLLNIAKNLSEESGLDFSMLHPLIRETVTKAIDIGPEKSQTGPALRGDQNVIFEHLALLKDKPEYSRIYALITRNIQQHYKLDD